MRPLGTLHRALGVILVASGIVLGSPRSFAQAPTDVDPALTLAPGVVPYGYSYEVPTAHRAGDRVSVQGLVHHMPFGTPAKWKKGQHIATLPEGMRPRGRLIFNVNHQRSTARVDVLADGRVLYMEGTGKIPWMSLSGITFSVTGALPASEAVPEESPDP
ncbi:MAG: hypothetical protein AAF211_28190 [Myxococcota bacterium]